MVVCVTYMCFAIYVHIHVYIYYIYLYIDIYMYLYIYVYIYVYVFLSSIRFWIYSTCLVAARKPWLVVPFLLRSIGALSVGTTPQRRAATATESTPPCTFIEGTPRVCRMMAFLAVVRGFGPTSDGFHFGGPGYLELAP